MENKLDDGMPDATWEDAQKSQWAILNGMVMELPISQEQKDALLEQCTACIMSNGYVVAADLREKVDAIFGTFINRINQE